MTLSPIFHVAGLFYQVRLVAQPQCHIFRCEAVFVLMCFSLKIMTVASAITGSTARFFEAFSQVNFSRRSHLIVSDDVAQDVIVIT